LIKGDLDEKGCVHAFETVLGNADAGTGLFTLKTLNLAHNDLPSGAIVKILNTFKAASLEGLTLSGNVLEENVDLVAAFYRHKPSLKYLSLANCYVAEGILAAVVCGLISSTRATSSKKTTVLKEIDLRGNVVEGQVVSILSAALSSKSNPLFAAYMGSGISKTGKQLCC
jgi:hypothetical protein|tara:strand:+ start:24 stop:533 length:510 start_codon:yes stop_codon:yes gene_type:complete